MALTSSRELKLGTEAPDFELLGVDGKKYRLGDFLHRKALVVVFMCNHCPYVVATQGRINGIAVDYAPRGVSLIGINPNDSVRYPDDSFDSMVERARSEGFVFPYLWDESQQAAKAYDAVCTPDPYLFANEGGRFILRYHGRIDDNWKEPGKVTRRDLRDAIEAVLSGRDVANQQIPAMGCSIKWK